MFALYKIRSTHRAIVDTRAAASWSCVCVYAKRNFHQKLDHTHHFLHYIRVLYYSCGWIMGQGGQGV